MQTSTKTFSRAPGFLVEDFTENIMHFKIDLMMLKQRIWEVRDTFLQDNTKIEELIEVSSESTSKLSSI